MTEPKKKGRTMTPELHEKLAKAREKGLETIRAKREAKEQAKKELEKKTKEIMNKSKLSELHLEDENDSYGSDFSTKSRFEEPSTATFGRFEKPKKIPKTPLAIKNQPPIAKYNGVKKIKKTKIVYLEDTENNSSSEEEEVIVRKAKSKPHTQQVPLADTQQVTSAYSRYSYLY